MRLKDYLRIKNFNKDYFTVSDLQKIFNHKKEVIYVTLHRLVKEGALIKIKNGIYQLPDANLSIERIANQIYSPSYLSFEYALSKYGILSQKPYTLTFVTIKKTKKMNLYSTFVEFKKIKNELFFGYRLIDGLYIANPEKALLDTIYFYSLGKEYIDIDELNLSKVNKTKIFKLVKVYPERTKEIIYNLFQ